MNLPICDVCNEPIGDLPHKMSLSEATKYPRSKCAKCGKEASRAVHGKEMSLLHGKCRQCVQGGS